MPAIRENILTYYIKTVALSYRIFEKYYFDNIQDSETETEIVSNPKT